MITKKKNYIKGGVKLKKFDNGGEILNVDLLLSDLEKLPVSKMGYVKITLASLKTPDKFGNSHSIYENDFVPSAAEAKAKTQAVGAQQNTFKKRPDNILPF